MTYDEMVERLTQNYRELRSAGLNDADAAADTDILMRDMIRHGLRREVASVMLPTQHDAQVAEGHS